MKTIVTSIAISILFTTLAIAQPAPHYVVVDLGTLGGSFGLAFGINDKGQVDGFANLPGDKAQHAFVYANGVMTDLGTLGGPNSASYEGPTAALQAGGLAETSTPDPNDEDFCGYGDNLICLAFSWQNGVMTPLDTLGGNNAQGGGINDRGQIAGFAENNTADPSCPSPQVLQFKPVVWTNGHIQPLPTYPGDPEGGVFYINNEGEMVGASGVCAAFNSQIGVPLQARHALLWRKGSSVPVDLGNLGGKINNVPFAMNDHEQVVGISDVPGDQYQHAFLWQKGAMTDLGTLPGDVTSDGCGINNRGQVSGGSTDANGNSRAFLWQNGQMYDLNTLIPPNSPLYLLHAFNINSSGEIVGFAYNTQTGNVDAYVAIPTNFGGGGIASAPAGGGSGVIASRVALPENVRKQLQQWAPRSRGFTPPAADPQSSSSR